MKTDKRIQRKRGNQAVGGDDDDDDDGIGTIVFDCQSPQVIDDDDDQYGEKEKKQTDEAKERFC